MTNNVPEPIRTICNDYDIRPDNVRAYQFDQDTGRITIEFYVHVQPTPSVSAEDYNQLGYLTVPCPPNAPVNGTRPGDTLR